jgi:hypothetical protein
VKGKQKGQRGQKKQKGLEFLLFLPSLLFLLPLWRRINRSFGKKCPGNPAQVEKFGAVPALINQPARAFSTSKAAQ